MKDLIRGLALIALGIAAAHAGIAFAPLVAVICGVVFVTKGLSTREQAKAARIQALTVSDNLSYQSQESE